MIDGYSYQFLIEDRELDTFVFDTIMNLPKEQLAFYLISEREEERWIAKLRWKDLESDL